MEEGVGPREAQHPRTNRTQGQGKAPSRRASPCTRHGIGERIEKNGATPRRLLVIRLGAFGDVVRTLPAAFALRRRHPDATLSWLVEPGAEALLARLPWLDEVRVFPRAELEALVASRSATGLLRRVGRVRRELGDASYDSVIDFHGILKSGVLARLTGAARRIGLAAPHAREGAAAFYTERVRLGEEPCTRWDRNAALAARLDARVDAAPIPGLVRAPAPARGAHALLHPGSSPGTPHKRYPIDRFAEVARGLAHELGVPCVVTCGADPEDRATARTLVARARDAARLVETGGEVDVLLAELASARLVVSGDTGPLHLASLCGAPVVQILGPTHPVQNEPWPHGPWARAHLPLPCSPCRRGCAAAPCMAQLPVADVLGAARRVLAASVGSDARPGDAAPTQSGATSQGVRK